MPEPSLPNNPYTLPIRQLELQIKSVYAQTDLGRETQEAMLRGMYTQLDQQTAEQKRWIASRQPYN
jgi:hypothetical protein